MKVEIIKNGGIKFLLVPEEGDELELAALKQLSRIENIEITFSEDKFMTHSGIVKNGLMIKSKDKPLFIEQQDKDDDECLTISIK